MTRVWDQDITPFRGIGPLLFGMTKEDVRALLGSPEREFVRNPEFAPDRIEWIYDEGRGFVSFNGTGVCDEIMLCPPAEPRLEGVQLLSIPAGDAWSELRRLDGSAFSRSRRRSGWRPGSGRGPSVWRGMRRGSSWRRRR
jgi:hypothetical protein